MEFDYGVLVSLVLTWVIIALIGAVIMYFIVRLAVAHGLRAHDRKLDSSRVAPSSEH